MMRPNGINDFLRLPARDTVAIREEDIDERDDEDISTLNIHSLIIRYENK